MSGIRKALMAGVSVLVFGIAGAAAQTASGGAAKSSATASAQAPSPASGAQSANAAKPDHAGSYYHFMLGRRYEELAGMAVRSGQIDKATSEYQRAISEFQQAIVDDPDSPFLRVQLAQLYMGVNRVPDAIHEVQGVLQTDPNDADAHRLLAHIYLGQLDSPSGTVSKDAIGNAIREFDAVTRLDPNDTESFLILGRLYRFNNQYDESEATFKRLLAAHPDLQVARIDLADLYSDQGEYNKAITVLQQIPTKEMDSDILYALGYDELRAGRFDEAKALFEKAISDAPGDVKFVRAYAEALMATGNTDLARQELQKVVEEQPDDPRAYLRLAQLDRAEGQWDDARQNLAKAQQLAPGNPEVPYQQALLDSTLGQDDEAIQLLNGLLKQNTRADGQYTPAEANNRAIFLERLGLIYRTQGKFDEALAEFRQMLALGDSQAPHAEALVIETLALSHHPHEALKEGEAAAKKYPNSRELVMERASLIGAQGNPGLAVRQLQMLIKGTPSDREVYMAIAQIYLQAKQYPKAQAAAERALVLSPRPDDQKYALFLLGSVYEREKKYDKAEAEFKKVLSLDPLNAPAANYLGYMLAERGVELQDSVRYIKQALKTDPNNGAYLDSLGWAYYKMNRFEEAEAPLQKAVEQLSNDPTVLDHIGHVYLRLGKKRQAQQAWEHALKEWPTAFESDFGPKQAAQLEKELKKLNRELAKDKTSSL